MASIRGRLRLSAKIGHKTQTKCVNHFYINTGGEEQLQDIPNNLKKRKYIPT